MKRRGAAAFGTAIALALASQASGSSSPAGSTSHMHFCDCGHPQGRMACGGGTSGLVPDDGADKPASTRLKTASHGAALIATSRAASSESYSEAPMIEEPANTMKIRLSVLAVLLPCLFALGLLFLGAMSRRG